MLLILMVDETITEIHLALNDTSNYIKLYGSTRLISLIIEDINSDSSRNEYLFQC